MKEINFLKNNYPDKKIKSETVKNRPIKSKNKVPFENFININSKDVAYVLGFIWADGNIRKPYTISIVINGKDSEDIKNVFQKSGEWNYYYYDRFDNRTNKTYKNFQIQTSNKNLVNFLIDNDYDKKSLLSPTKILSKIPEEYKLYFFRGFSDGDGCFYKKNRASQYSLTGSYFQDWTAVENLFNLLNITYTIRYSSNKKSKYSQIRITNKNDIDIFGKYIYDNFDGTGLKRKYLKYCEIKKISINRIIKWTDEEITFLKNNYKTSHAKLALLLNKSRYSIDAKSSKLKLKNSHNF